MTCHYRVLARSELSLTDRLMLASATMRAPLVRERYFHRFPAHPRRPLPTIGLLVETTAALADVTTPAVHGLYTPRRGALLVRGLRGNGFIHTLHHEVAHHFARGNFHSPEEEETAVEAFAASCCGGCDHDGPKATGGPPLRWARPATRVAAERGRA